MEKERIREEIRVLLKKKEYAIKGEDYLHAADLRNQIVKLNELLNPGK